MSSGAPTSPATPSAATTPLPALRGAEIGSGAALYARRPVVVVKTAGARASGAGRGAAPSSSTPASSAPSVENYWDEYEQFLAATRDSAASDPVLSSAAAALAASAASSSDAANAAAPDILAALPAAAAGAITLHPSSGGRQTPGGLARVPILVHRQRQAGNRLLDFIQHVPWRMADGLGPDFACGTACALVLSLRFHLRNPQYLQKRFGSARGSAYTTRVLLLLVDAPDGAAGAADVLTLITTLALTAGYTLLCAATLSEAGRYLELLHIVQDPASRGPFLREAAAAAALEGAPVARALATALGGSVRVLNKNDAASVAEKYHGSLRALSVAGEQELAGLEGMGPTKARELWQTLHAPFE